MKVKEDGLFKSVFFAHLIILFHILLILGMGLLVFFFKFIIHYWIWIILGCLSVSVSAGYLLIKKLKKSSNAIAEILDTPGIQGRPLEITFLGGLANVKIGSSSFNSGNQRTLIESSSQSKLRDLTDLARMFDKKLLTEDEFNRAKQTLLLD
ncbi:MAG: SHOCT domain-containing protein [Desulfobacterales bacterium]|nr:SHOCT domain-containing protein [Desulfobacterales bacterium]